MTFSHSVGVTYSVVVHARRPGPLRRDPPTTYLFTYPYLFIIYLICSTITSPPAPYLSPHQSQFECSVGSLRSPISPKGTAVASIFGNRAFIECGPFRQIIVVVSLVRSRIVFERSGGLVGAACCRAVSPARIQSLCAGSDQVKSWHSSLDQH
jgi:hypothetical protein